jgi:hypothetical protein
MVALLPTTASWMTVKIPSGKAGFETETVAGGTVVIKSFATQLMTWDVQKTS